MFYLYFLYSDRFKRYYIGVTKDLEQRLIKHNSGSTKSTKPFKPWKIIYQEKYTQKSSALKREFFLKSPSGYQVKREIISRIRGEVA